MTNPYNTSVLSGNTPAFKQYRERDYITPNFEYSEGTRPAGEFQVAPYLAAIRYSKSFEEHFVVAGGKVVAMDSMGYIVPAGLKKDLAAYITAFNGTTGAGTRLAPGGRITAGRAAAVSKYAQVDVDRGVKNSKGVAVIVGEPVVESFISTAVLEADADTTVAASDIVISNPVGVSSYNYWTNPGGNGVNPALYNTHNFNIQGRVAFVCDYQLELPTVEDNATYDAAPFAGMGAMVAAAGTVRPGKFVTYDARSNFAISADDDGYDFGTVTKNAEVVGQVLSIDERQQRDLLEWVRTRYNGFGELEKMPGTATGGKSDTLTYSGGYGLVRINLILR